MSEPVTRADVEELTLREVDKLLGRRRGFAFAELSAGRLSYTEHQPGRIRVPAWAIKEWQQGQAKRGRAA